MTFSRARSVAPGVSSASAARAASMNRRDCSGLSADGDGSGFWLGMGHCGSRNASGSIPVLRRPWKLYGRARRRLKGPRQSFKALFVFWRTLAACRT
jgi:hypothetical protein